MKVIDAKNVKELLTSLAIVPNMITEKWLNEHTLKAIPIEWIEEYAKSLVIKRRFLAENGYRDNRCYDYMFGIIGMLDDWDTEIREKENDRD